MKGKNALTCLLVILPAELVDYKNIIVDSAIKVYGTVCNQLLPTPAKSHYTFNLRDLAKVFQGMLMHQSKQIESVEKLTSLWFHEACRVFQDRLINQEDRDWFAEQLKTEIRENFQLDFNEATVVNYSVIFLGF